VPGQALGVKVGREFVEPCLGSHRSFAAVARLA
jgi:hypothetical protein